MKSTDGTGRERLAAMLEFLKTDPRVREHFDLSTITNGGPDTTPFNVNDCGSTACVCGWTPAVFTDLEWSVWGLVERGSSRIRFDLNSHSYDFGDLFEITDVEVFDQLFAPHFGGIHNRYSTKYETLDDVIARLTAYLDDDPKWATVNAQTNKEST